MNETKTENEIKETIKPICPQCGRGARVTWLEGEQMYKCGYDGHKWKREDAR